MLRSALTKTVLNANARGASRAVQPVLARGYHEKVISHYEKPRNVSRAPESGPPNTLSDNSAAVLQVGSLPKNAPDVGTGLVGAPA